MRRLSCSSFSRLAACSHIHSCLVQPSGQLHAPGKIENSRQIIWSYFGVSLIGDTQKLKTWMVYNGHSYQNAWFRGTPILEHLRLDPFGSNLVWLCLYGWSLDLSMNVHNQTGQLYSSATCQVDLDLTQAVNDSFILFANEPSNLLHQHWPNKHLIEVVGWSIMFSSQSLVFSCILESYLHIFTSYACHMPTTTLWQFDITYIINYGTQPISMILPIQHHVFHSYK